MLQRISVCIFLLLLGTASSFSQIPPQQEHGDRKYRKMGLHNGNLVETLFWNFGEVAWWGRQPAGVWPKGTNHSYMDGVTPIVAAEVITTDGDTIHIVEAGYREHYESDPVTGVEYGWQPLPGYANPNQDYIAMSDNPLSWPDHWPNRDASWDGKWNGYFGQRTNADQESYFVMDDYCDYGQAFRGRFYCSKYDSSRGGLGMRVEVRGFQWSNVLAEDLIFWHYDITNISTTHYQKTVFGMYVDCGIGGQFDSNDDNAYYDIDLDITYSWDTNGLGDTGWGPTGYAGYAFLESPGNPYNSIDDDGDGEDGSPVVTANDIIGEIPWNGVDDNGNGLIDESEFHIGMKKKDGIDNDGDGLVDEMIDEARDDGIDNDGDWDPEKDDVGRDGVPGTGDFGEGDGIPTEGEPHFDKTDKDESDQIGLTAFDSFYIGQGVEYRYDEVIWERIANYHFDSGRQNGNIAFLYGSGPFPLPPGKTQRFSLALVFGNDLADIRRNKEIVQKIYNANYNFARPPEKPQVWAVPGDGKVTLYWDRTAEFSEDEFADSTKCPKGKIGYLDFEGYKIYKSTDPAFLDGYVITDGHGNKSLFKPVAQFDIRNDVEGFFPIEVAPGVLYYMGDNKGLRHSWTDYDVVNGQTYYYAVVSYDRGWAANNMLPSECTKVIVRDIYGNITLDKNTVMVTPSTPAAGYREPELENGVQPLPGTVGTGDIRIDIIDPSLVKEGHEYHIVFDDTTQPGSITYSLYDVTDPSNIKTIFEDSPYINNEDFNPLFDGMRLLVKNDMIAWNDSLTGWTKGNCNLAISVEFESSTKYPTPNSLKRQKGYPVSYEIRVGEPDTSWLYNTPRHTTNFQVWNLVDNEKVRYYLWEESGKQDSVLSAGDYIEIWLKVNNRWKKIWKIKFMAPIAEEIINPVAGDRAVIEIDKPFRSGDVFSFRTKAARVDRQAAKSSLDRIAVVPNPYVAAATWEPPRLFASGRGERKIDFIHLPQRATIRIYTMSGHLVRLIEHDAPMNDGSESWNLTSKDGLDVAAGVYIYHVEAPGVGEKIGKFAIIK